MVCTYWTSENGQKVRHREEKIIDFFSSDVTGFNFGMLPTPTPTPTPTQPLELTPRPLGDPFYDNQVRVVLHYLEQWADESGNEAQTRQKIVDWINGNLPSAPPRPDGMVKAYIDQSKDTTIMFEFEDKTRVSISTDLMPYPNYDETNAIIEDLNSQKNINNKPGNSQIVSSEVIEDFPTFEPQKVLMLDSITTWQYWFTATQNNPLYEASHPKTIGNYLENSDFYKDKVKIKFTGLKDIVFDFDNANPSPQPEAPDINSNEPYVPCHFNSDTGNIGDIITPWDYGNLIDDSSHDTMLDYGMVYIGTHGNPDSLVACICIDENPDIQDWIDRHQDVRGICWNYSYQKIDFWAIAPALWGRADRPTYDNGYIKVIALEEEFFRRLYSNSSSLKSLIYIHACDSYGLSDIFTQHGAVYLGMSKSPCPIWSDPLTFFFFEFMLTGYYPGINDPIFIPGIHTINPYYLPKLYSQMNVNQSHNALTQYFGVNPDPLNYDMPPFSTFTSKFDCEDCELVIHNPSKLYFPTEDLNIGVHKK